MGTGQADLKCLPFSFGELIFTIFDVIVNERQMSKINADRNLKIEQLL